MRMKRNRVKVYYLKSKEVRKDEEGSPEETYENPIEFSGEVWPAGGKLQAEIYGDRLSYIRNVRIDGKYVITKDRTGVVHYVYPDGLDVVEGAGLCLDTSSEDEPDYRVIAIKPYEPLRLECERL